MEQIHATCVSFDGSGVLLRGPSGSGKSDLALRLIDGGAALVADDRVDLVPVGGRLFAAAPAALAGLLEVRGLGIIRLPAAARTPVVLVVDLVPAETVERMPEPEVCALAGIELPRIGLAAFEASAAAKVRLAVRGARADIITPP